MNATNQTLSFAQCNKITLNLRMFFYCGNVANFNYYLLLLMLMKKELFKKTASDLIIKYKLKNFF